MSGRTFIPKRIFLFFLALALLLPFSAGAADKTVVLFPLVVYSDQPKSFLGPGLRSMFISRLAGEGIELISDERLYPLLTEKEKKGLDSRERAEAVARELKADYAIFGSVTSISTGYSLDLSVLDLTKDEPKLTAVSETVQEDQLIPKVADVVYDFRAIMAGVDIRALSRAGAQATKEEGGAMGLFFKPGAEDREFRPAGRKSVNMRVLGFDTGDLNGDGEPEMVAISRDKLLIYNRKGETLALKATMDSPFGRSFFKVSIGDANGDGKAEIYLVSSVGLRAETSVWEWTGTFRKLYEKVGHMEVVKTPGTRPLLLFQESLATQYFSGRIQVLTYSGKAEPVMQDTLPEFKKGIQFYTLATLNPYGSQRFEFLGLNDDNFLCLWDREGNILWQREERVGGTSNSIALGRAMESSDIPEMSYFNARVVVADIDKDGKNEVVLIDNIPLVGHLATFSNLMFDSSNLEAFRVEGASLVPRWKTRNIPYCLTDMQAEGGTLYLAAQKGELKMVGSGSGRIMWFE